MYIAKLKAKIYGLITLLTFMGAYSQDQLSQATKMPDVIPPSPTVANLMHFEEVPVDLYTGQPDISIPLYSKKLNSELSLPIALKYNSTGVKVNERSGWIGTGWSLEAGGVVSRTVRGGADESIPYGQDKMLGILQNPDFWNFNTLNAYDMQEFLWNANGTRWNVYDTQPDLYQFSMLGMSGRFIIDAQTHMPILLTQDQKYNIEVHFDFGDTNGNNNQFEINGFTITDANGYKYLFQSVIETNFSVPFTLIYRQNHQGAVVPEPSLPTITSRSAWHLTSIKTSRNIELVSFTYSQSEEVYTTPRSVTENIINNTGAEWNLILQNATNGAKYFRPAKIDSRYTITTNTYKLKEILFKDNTKLNFVHTAENSHPENEGIYLDKIQLYAGGSLKRTFDLVHEITTDNGRLWLTDVRIDNVDNYELEYFEHEDVPDLEATPDAWGYAIADYTFDLSYGYSYYDFDAFKRGLLTGITFPTGGVKKFNFQPHTFTYEGDTKIDDFSSNPHNVTNQSYSHYFMASQTGGVASPTTLSITHDHYILVDDNIVSGSGNKEFFYVEFRRSDGYHQDVGFDAMPKLVPLPAGNYTVYVRPYVILITAPYKTMNAYVNVSYEKLKTGSDYKRYLLGGGARIATVDFIEPASSGVPVQKRKVYKYEKLISIGLNSYWESSGSVDSQIGNLYKEYEISDSKYLYSDASEFTIQQKSIQYVVKTHEPNIQLTKGSYVGYKHVRVYDGHGHIEIPGQAPQLGYTEYEYTTAQDFPYPEEVFHYPYTEAPNLDHKRGLLLNKTVFNSDSEILEKTVIDIADYDFKEGNAVKSFGILPPDCKWRQFYETFENYYNLEQEYTMVCQTGGEAGAVTDCLGGQYFNCGAGPYIALVHDIRPARAELRKSTTTTYPDGGTNGITKTTYYTYNDTNYQAASEMFELSEGSATNQYKTEYEYPVGGYSTTLFTDPGEQDAIDTMADLNIINKPVVITTSKNGSVLQRVVNKYKEFTSDQILLKEVETLKTGATGGAEDRVMYNLYDDKGNIQEISMANGLPISYLWAYNGTAPVAKLEGVAYAAIPSNLKGAVIGATTETALRSALNALHAHYASNNTVQVTTFLQDPAKGVILEVKDPRGYLLKYSYDILGRLTSVKDENNNILSENRYNYRP